MRGRHIGWAVPTVLALGFELGCGAAPLSENGDLGNGTFTYVCVDMTDPTCTCASSTLGCTGATSANFPFPTVALGARFEVTYSVNSSVQGVGQPTLSPISPDYLQSLQSTGTGFFLTLKPGLAGMFAESTVNGSFVDYQLVNVVVPISLQVSQLGTPVSNTVSLTTGQSAPFTVVPVGALSGQPLAGALDATWTTSDATVASLPQNSATPSDSMTITGNSPGTATISVTSPGNAPPATFTVQVQ